MTLDEMAEGLRKVSAVMDALDAAYRKLSALPSVVDDDYPEARHYYDGALATLLERMGEAGYFLCDTRYGLIVRRYLENTDAT